MRLIVVEDDKLLGSAMQKSLARDGFAVDWVENSGDFFEAHSCHQYDFIILDLCLPDGCGEGILQQLQKRSPQLPTIVVSSRTACFDRVHLLDMGADDFLPKPFELAELSARIRSVMRRLAVLKSEDSCSQFGALRLFTKRCAASIYGRDVVLTHREFWLLEILVRRKHQIVSRSDMEDALYGWGKEIESNAIEVYVHNLRQKLGPDVIHTIRGAGYRLSAQLEVSDALAH